MSRDVGGHPADERGDDDGDAAHRRRALLGHVVLRAVVFLAEDRLAAPTGAEEHDQAARAEQRDERRDRAGDHDGDHDGAPGESIGSCVAEHLAGDDTVVERDDLVADGLGGLVALAGDHDDVAGPGPGDAHTRSPPRRSISTCASPRPGRVDAFDRCVDDRLRVLVARVVGRDDDESACCRRGRAHQRTLLRVAVAAAAEHDDRPDRRARSQRAGVEHLHEPSGVWA